MEVNDGTGRQFWSVSSAKYFLATILNVEEKLNWEGKRFPSKCRTALKSSYAPDMDVTTELKAARIQYYQELIGALRWA